MSFGNFLRTPEREQRVAYSNAIWHLLFRLVGSPSKAKSFTDRAGHAVAHRQAQRCPRGWRGRVNRNSTTSKSIAAEQRLSAVGMPSPNGAIEALRSDNADFALLSVAIAYDAAQREPHAATGVRWPGNNQQQVARYTSS